MIVEGKFGTFGGPHDTGVKPDEGLALFERSEIGKLPASFFLPQQPPGTTGLARRLNPDAFYVAMEWNYKKTPRSYLQGIEVELCDPHHPELVIKARPVDAGPNPNTRRVVCLSPGAAKALDLTTDRVVRVTVPLPGERLEDATKSSSPAPIPSPSPATITVLRRQQWPLQRDCPAFYGNPANPSWLHSNTVNVQVPWQMHMDKTPINHILIHKKCADSLARVLAYIWEQCGKDQNKIAALRYDRFSGSYNFRPMRGGAALSMHSYAAAIDWDDEDNQQHSQHHLFTDDSLLVRAFKAEGWEWGGDWGAGSVDAMHLQAARVHGG